MHLLVPHPTGAAVRPLPRSVTDIRSPAPRDIWYGVLRDDPGATALQTPEYLDAVLAATGGRDASRFYQLAGGRQLVLPLVRVRTAGGRLAEAGYPAGLGHAGLLATGGLLADDLGTVRPDGVVEERRRVETIELDRDHGGDLEGFRHAYYAADVSERIRQADRDGLEVGLDTSGELAAGDHDLRPTWAGRPGLLDRLPEPVTRRLPGRGEADRALAPVAEHLGDRCRVHLVRHRGRPVAAAVLLVHGAQAVVWRRYGRPGADGPAEADLLARTAAVEDAVGAGCRTVDLGPTDPATGRRARSALGAEPRWVVDLRIRSAGPLR